MKKITMVIDSAMILILPLLMAYSLLSEKYHECLGIAMGLLFLSHHMINYRWWKTLFKGKYTASRILNTVINILLTFYMILQPLSGIAISKYVLKGISFGLAALFRSLHMTLAYWGFVLMSFHLGLHVVNMKAKLQIRNTKIFAVIFFLIGMYGIYAFYSRGFFDYLYLRVMFVYFDYSESLLLFYFDYLSVMVLFAQLAYYLDRELKRR